jgi:RimJ/RimL family protein N-acetyltransferase
MNKPFVPVDFVVPEKLETDRFRLRMLTINDVVKDYDAVMTSVDHLQGVFGARSTWPAYDLTLEQDLIDLGWHQKEFQRRSSFAYTVMDLDESQCLGCMYIFPSSEEGYEAEVYCWVRKSEYDKGLDPILFDAVKTWIGGSWPFQKVHFPVRT